MKLSSAVKAIMPLCLLLADGLPVSKDECPKIIGHDHVKRKAHPGDHLLLHCKAFANSDVDMTVIYWLVDGSFPEDIHSSDRIVELEESTSNDGAILQRNLLLKNVTTEDLKSTFTCVVTNAAGTALKHTTLSSREHGCDAGKRGKH